METSLGIFETKGFAAAVAAAEKILEENIELIKIEKAGGGIITIFFKGEYEKLNKAFESGIHAARQIGEITSIHILKQPNHNIERKLFDSTTKADRISPVEIKKDEEAATPVKVKIEEKEIPVKKTSPEKLQSVSVEKTKPLKTRSTSSTIQRLRQEALSSISPSKEKAERTKTASSKSSSQINMNKLESLNVHELRRAARSTANFPIQGRQISRANRKELLDYFSDLS